jgi:hypothetical protein
MKRRTPRRSKAASSNNGPADRIDHGELTQAATLQLEIAPRFDPDEFTETEWSAFMGLSAPDTRS